jgi:hypothetical protein
MVQSVSLIEHLRSKQPATWSLLKLAASQGLVSIDDSAETVSLGEELGTRHQRLHFLLARLIREWDPEQSGVAS